MPDAQPILEVRGVSKSFGALRALAACDLTVQRGEIVGLIGPNGSGKTTLFNILAGSLAADSGQVLFCGENISGWPAYRVARKGIGRTFQITRVFPQMTLLENLRLAAGSRHGTDKARELLSLVGLLQFEHEYAADLSFGQQRLLSLIQVLTLDPALVLLDEPAAGVNPNMQNTMLDLIHHLNGDGKTFLIVEHNMDVVMNHCGRVVVLNLGEKIAEGAPQEVRRNEAVLSAYFGS